jgi:Arc-like DNA binding domain
MAKTKGRKATDIVQVNLRLREDLRRKLVREAAGKKRSLNTEMVERLEASFAAQWPAQAQLAYAALGASILAGERPGLAKQITDAIKDLMDSGPGSSTSLVDETGMNITVSKPYAGTPVDETEKPNTDGETKGKKK